MAEGWEHLCTTSDEYYAEKIRQRGRCIFKARFGDPECQSPAIYEYSTANGDMFICCQLHADEWAKHCVYFKYTNWHRTDLGQAKPGRTTSPCVCAMNTLMSTGCKCGGS